MYAYAVPFWTTTSKTPEDIEATGMVEVARLRAEMERVKTEVGFKGNLKAFFDHLNNDKSPCHTSAGGGARRVSRDSD